jgi:hypothetical protein
LLYPAVMEERLDRPATSFANACSGEMPVASRFERPQAEQISLCCEISAYAPDGDDRPLF